MKRFIILIVLALCCTAIHAADIQRVDPPFWYTGMKNTELQVMFYGVNISEASFSMDKYDGVTVKEVCKEENPNYLFVYLDVTAKAQPGTLNFRFKEGKKVTSHQFELRPRNNKPGAMGFSPKDVLYLIMPDRFANGNPDNDNLDGYIANRQGGGRHGGDLQGIMEHLDYIDDLGVTAIWLNPIQFNKGNNSHGYAISDFYLVEPRLGSNEEYCKMIDTAHEKGIKVVMDMIFNHSGSSHWWITDVPTSDWFNQNDQAVSTGKRMLEAEANRGRQQQQQRQFNGNRGRQQVQLPASIAEFEALPQEQKDALIRSNTIDHDALVTTTHYKWTLLDPHAPQSEKDILVEGWFSGGMPDLNQKNRHLANYLIQNSIWWIEYSRIDGIRMDTYPYADFDFMARWCDEITAEYPDFNIVGEGWYPRNSAAGWWQGGSAVHASDSKLKTVMDFDLTFTTQNEILKESNTSEGSEAGLFKMYECVTQDFLIPDPNYVLTFLDNHDIARFMKPGDPIWKFKQGLAFLLTTRGIPQIYYGTEIMMGVEEGDFLRADFPGGWAEDAKSAFTAEGRSPEQNESWNFASKLLNWRRTSKPVTEGKLVHYTPDNKTKCYVYARTDGNETVLVILNGSDTMRLVDMSRFSEVVKDNTKGKDVVTGETVDLTSLVKIEPRGVYVLELSK